MDGIQKNLKNCKIVFKVELFISHNIILSSIVLFNCNLNTSGKRILFKCINKYFVILCIDI